MSLKINIIGTGYVGLISGVCLSKKGHDVTCFDDNEKIVNSLNKAIPTIYEKNLEEELKEVIRRRKFRAVVPNSSISLIDCDVVLIAVGTPTKKNKIDLSYIKNVSAQIGLELKNSNKFVSVIIKSTVIPSTTDTIVKKIIENKSGKTLGEFGLGMNPEFLREGNAMEDFMNPDRIVIGHEDSKTESLMKKMYKPWGCDKIFVNSRTAEMIKYVNNSLLATQISTVNEYSNISNKIGDIDFKSVMNAVHLDSRWSPILSNGERIRPKIIDYLIPGAGFGGSCFPKDIKALSSLAKSVNVKSRILNSVIEVNKDQPKHVVERLKEQILTLKEKKILILGLSFKPDTDDIRESISLKLIKLLLRESASVYATDPISIQKVKKNFDSLEINFIEDWQNYLGESDIVVLATSWPQYIKITSPRNKSLLEKKIIFDCRNFLSKEDFPKSTFLNF